MARANPHLRAHDLLLIDADIAHIRLAIEREFDSRFPQPVLPRFYWRERLRVLVSAFYLLPGNPARLMNFCADLIVTRKREGSRADQEFGRCQLVRRTDGSTGRPLLATHPSPYRLGRCAAPDAANGRKHLCCRRPSVEFYP